MDEKLQYELIVMGEADRAATSAFYETAEQYRSADTSTQMDSDLPWPFGLLESSPEMAPAPARHVVEVIQCNTARLRQIVARHGWPGRSRVGEDGADAAWLILQHASSGVSTLGTPANLAFCRSCVPLLEKAVADREAHPRHLAATIDSLRRAEGRPPMFGVLSMDYQIVNGEPVFAVPVDTAMIDRQRARIGLPSLASDVRRRRRGDSLDPAGPDRAEPWPAPASSTRPFDPK